MHVHSNSRLGVQNQFSLRALTRVWHRVVVALVQSADMSVDIEHGRDVGSDCGPANPRTFLQTPDGILPSQKRLVVLLDEGRDMARC